MRDNINKVKFYTLGCKVNQYETQKLREIFLSAGFSECADPSPAGICVINTCTVTAKADNESLRMARIAVRDNPGAQVIVTGCFVERDREKVNAIPGVTLAIDNSQKERILEYIGSQPVDSLPIQKGISFFQGRSRAFLKIQDGCDNRCAYCKVALVRGSSRSREESEIITEAARLAGNGFSEIVLTGICLGAYGRESSGVFSLPKLLRRLQGIEAIKRIRLSSIEMADVNAELIDTCAGLNKVCPHFHLPLQSGDDSILRNMRRRYDGASFLDCVRRLRSSIPGVSVTTDVLVGFPGEDEQAFENTCRLLRQIMPLKTHVFPYSRREGTPAAVMPEEVDRGLIKQRCLRLSVLAGICAREYMSGFIGKTAEILLEEYDLSGRTKRMLEGYTGNYIRVLLEPVEVALDQRARVRLVKVNNDHMIGELFKE